MYEGILPVWKEKGMTSHDVVFKVRKILKMKKVGHTGTLDPDVDGVLPICLGKATKVVEYLMNSGKTYVGEITIGYSTTTEDASGDLVEEQAVDGPISTDRIDEVLRTFEGEIEQTPPMFSAVKINGKRLYEYAREGKVIDRPSRKVTIHSFKRLSEPTYNEESKTVSFHFEAKCSKGTYIRTLAVDTGAKLGYPAHMSSLTRTESGSIQAYECIKLDELQKLMEEDRVETILSPIERGLTAFPSIDLTDEQWSKVMNGAVLNKSDFDYVPEDQFVMTYQGHVVSIYGTHPNKSEFIKPVKVLRNTL